MYEFENFSDTKDYCVDWLKLQKGVIPARELPMHPGKKRTALPL